MRTPEEHIRRAVIDSDPSADQNQAFNAWWMSLEEKYRNAYQPAAARAAWEAQQRRLEASRRECGEWKESAKHWSEKFISQSRECEELRGQIDKLAKMLVEEFGGPTCDESACEMAVRLLRGEPEKQEARER